MKEYYVIFNGIKIQFYNLYTEFKQHNIDSAIANDSLYFRDDHDFKFISKLTFPGTVAYDIGAYIGTFSISLALLGLEVHAFEGAPNNYNRLKKNCKPFRQIYLHDIALSNENNEYQNIEFNDCTDNKDIKQNIKYVILDEYIQKNNLSLPAFVKMDIEGMESIVLNTSKILLEKARPVWMIEFHPNNKIKYKNYPGFKSVDEGGFDFNTFFRLDYMLINKQFNEVKNIPNNDTILFFIPKEKIRK